MDMILSYTDAAKSITSDVDALLLYCLGTRWMDCFAIKSQCHVSVHNSIKRFEGPKDIVHYVYSDRSKAIMRALHDLKIMNDTSIPGIPRTNGIAERQVQEVIFGTRTLLVMAGFPASFWPFAMAFYCMAHNTRTDYVDTKREEWRSPWYLRHGSEFKGTIAPFGCLVTYRPSPSSEKGHSARSQGKMKYSGPYDHGVFVGYRLLSGGIWRNDYDVIPLRAFCFQDFSVRDAVLM